MFAIRKLSTTISHTFFEFLKTLFEVLNESDRKLTNTYVNNQKCHKHFQYTKEKKHLNRCRKHVSDRRPPIKWNSKWKYWSEKLVYWKKKTINYLMFENNLRCRIKKYKRISRIVGYDVFVIGIENHWHDIYQWHDLEYKSANIFWNFFTFFVHFFILFRWQERMCSLSWEKLT